jgi:RNA polymerase sigma factor (TIGR02999 family)
MADLQTVDKEKLKRIEGIFDEFRASGKTTEEIFVAAYQDLKQLARKMLGGQPAGRSMNASRLLSDLWLKVFGRKASDFNWESGSHFFRTMALAMRQLLIDHARSRRHHVAVPLSETIGNDGQILIDTPAPQHKNWFEEKSAQTLDLEKALKWLEEESESEVSKHKIAKRQAEIVRLRLYSGHEEDEVAQILGVSSETVTKDFRKAKAKLLYFLETVKGGGAI